MNRRLLRSKQTFVLWLVMAFRLAPASESPGQKAWFADGFHGGIYGHYPPTFTQFMVDGLRTHPEWKLNLEIEPETWDFARTNTPEAYEQFNSLVTVRGHDQRVELVNPAYGQSYLWNISGESVIQQLERGLLKLRDHFPDAEIKTYCSEEPCFTSALPGILKSFGFKYAVLKNPNTCWGGYARAHGGELVSWVGPDGTVIPTVPRYQIEALKPGSVWETIAAFNLPVYVSAAREAGIAHPIGMCLQDAGWRFGPWLQHGAGAYMPSEYVTWSQYFESVATQQPAPEWRVSQEDVQVGLVWGAQVLQRIAQQVRNAENRLVTAEKLATLASVYRRAPWPESSFNNAWRTLLLAQHHDCWIVPYNGRRGDTWADKVQRWTDATCEASDNVIHQSTALPMPRLDSPASYGIRVFNTLSMPRTNLVSFTLPEVWHSSEASVWDNTGREISSQIVSTNGRPEVIFAAPVPPLGYRTFWLRDTPATRLKGATAMALPDGALRLETDLCHVELDPKRGGTLRSLIAKRLGNRELVDRANARCFNELRGFFFKENRYFSTAESAAKVDIAEAGPVRIRVRVSSQIASNAVTQWITLVQGEPRIDFALTVDWKGSPGIGADLHQSGGFRWEQDRKAFYDDRQKLLALFPLNFTNQTIFKDAPFDLTESHLTNTFFETWSEIKNNVVLHWVDVREAAGRVGVALLTDHTTSYEHGEDHPLGLTLQYCGIGLWGRDYSVRGPTEVKYALLPHAADADSAALWAAGTEWNEPLVVSVGTAGTNIDNAEKSLMTTEDSAWEVPTMRFSEGKVLIRLFNPSSDSRPKTLHYNAPASKVELVQLNGELIKEVRARKNSGAGAAFELALPPKGIGTLRITP
jgi:alpha-mannosidase